VTSAARAPAEAVGAVIFDYGGVISARLLDNLERFETAMGYPPGSVHELMFGPTEPADGEVPDFHQLETGELSLVEYLQGLERRAPDLLGRPLDLEAYRAFTAASPLAVHWPVVHRVRALRDDGMPLALLTNNVREFGDAWRSSIPVDELFVHVVDSCEVGMRKPDPRIYRHTCELLDVAPTAAVFVDDNLENCAAAAAVGLEAVRFGPDPWASLAELDAVLARRGVRPR
jgi:epoxide hydrolase-like predicted phosphatase